MSLDPNILAWDLDYIIFFDMFFCLTDLWWFDFLLHLQPKSEDLNVKRDDLSTALMVCSAWI